MLTVKLDADQINLASPLPPQTQKRTTFNQQSLNSLSYQHSREEKKNEEEEGKI
jgi:hypothetical protein